MIAQGGMMQPGHGYPPGDPRSNPQNQQNDG